MQRLPTLSFILHTVVLCDTKIAISTADELVSFSDSVNSGTTVLLVADIDFHAAEASSAFTQIGRNDSNRFAGVFYGQGHTISSLKVNILSQQKYAGLFGYAVNSAIRNFVLDSSCRISSYSDAFTVYAGGVA